MAMADMLTSPRWRAKEGTRKWMGTSASDPAVQNTMGARGMEVGRAALAWLPRRHLIEHVSCNDVAGVGRIFGLCMGLIWIWTKKQSCHTQPAL